MKSQLIGKDSGAGKDGMQKNKEVVEDEIQLINCGGGGFAVLSISRVQLLCNSMDCM